MEKHCFGLYIQHIARVGHSQKSIFGDRFSVLFQKVSNVPFWETLFGDLCDFGVSFGLQLDSIWRIGWGVENLWIFDGFPGGTQDPRKPDK